MTEGVLVKAAAVEGLSLSVSVFRSESRLGSLSGESSHFHYCYSSTKAEEIRSDSSICIAKTHNLASESLQEESYSEEMVGGGVDLSCFHLIEPGFDEASLDVLPILLEEASFPAREKSASLDQDVCSISVLPEGGKTRQLLQSMLTFLSFFGIPFASKDQISLDAQMGCQSCINFQMESDFAPCIVDINLENNCEMLKSDEPVGTAKSEGVITNTQKVLQRQASAHIDKSTSERVHDAPANHWRRYKRAASFDSRKIVIFFSVLSSIGTMILIYLTLRVRWQISDGFHHI